MLVAKPTWDDDVRDLFAAPYWIDPAKRANLAQAWLRCMGGAQTEKDPGYFVYLDKVDSVKEWSVTIYNHLASRSMPLTTDQSQFWPTEALETFRLWVNQGWRVNSNSPFNEAERIPPPAISPETLRIRPDIRSLSDAEIDVYRSRLDDIMQIGNPDPGSPWQRYAYIHTNWCLHYQEAFAFWHRAYLIYLEALIDHPIPYWDWMAQDASIDGSPEAGLPQAFLDETYVHSQSGETRPNPLRYAAAKDGESKRCVIGQMSGPDCRYVQRNPLFYTTGDDQREARTKLYAMSKIFQQQVVDALKFESFSHPQGVPGFPWANIPAFDPPQKDSLYPYRDCNFDGLYEQPHDNYHGWISFDMADNAFTAFDPVFSSYHANIDRMLEVWIRSHPGAQFTTQAALQPFLSPESNDVSYSSPDQWRYTSIGEMAQDSRRIGYDYGKPVSPQFQGVVDEGKPGRCSTTNRTGPAAGQSQSGGNETRMEGPWVVFDGVRCTHDSYFIDVFLNDPQATAEDAEAANPHFVGRFSRIGMGLVDDKGRCIKHGVSRALNAASTVAALGLKAEDNPHVSVVVTHLDTGRQLNTDEYQRLPGFEPTMVWGNPSQSLIPTRARSEDGAGCCSTE